MNKLRRRLLIAAGLVGGAFVVGGYFFYRERDRLRLPEGFAAPKGESWLTGWLRIGTDGTVTVAVPRQEMGQGITTALPMLVAEELDCDLAKLRFEQAPVDPLYANATMLGDAVPFRPDDQSWMARLARHTQFKFAELLGVQATGGSSSTRDGWEVMRQAGAAARAMLIGAAAARWNVSPAECRTGPGLVRHVASDRSFTYGELVADAARQPIPAEPALKNPAQYRVIGTPFARLDVPAKTEGQAGFGIDTREPGMRYAAIAQCPVFGGSLKRADDSKAKTMPGVQQVIELEATSTSAAAVAVVADSWWRAKSRPTRVLPDRTRTLEDWTGRSRRSGRCERFRRLPEPSQVLARGHREVRRRGSGSGSFARNAFGTVVSGPATAGHGHGDRSKLNTREP
jgi:isoquinoline 1-oxidoreductase beta subunit